MRKFFQDYSTLGVVLIFCSLVLGFLFRLFALPEVSAWGDEIASLFYANNLSEIFHHESHTPLYYFICKIWMVIFGESIVALRYLFVFLSFSLLSLSSWLLLQKKETGFFLLFVILWWLWPTDVIYSRQSRHYGLYAELSFFYLIFWRVRGDYPAQFLYISGVFVQFLHPFMIVPVWFLAAFDFIKRRLTPKKFLLVLATSLPLLTYYLARFVIYGHEKVMSNINWIQDKLGAYLEGLILLFAGDSFPLNKFYPLSLISSLLFLFIIGTVLLTKTSPKESWLKFVVILLLSLVATQLVSGFSNIRVPRYCMYLVPFFLYALLDSVNEGKTKENLLRGGLLIVILTGYQVLIFRPWSSYSWDDQSVATLKQMLKTLPPRELVVCGNRYQLDFYFKKPNLTCSQVAISLVREKQAFYLFDINGNDKLLSAYLLQEAELSFVKKIQHSTLIGVEPRR